MTAELEKAAFSINEELLPDANLQAALFDTICEGLSAAFFVYDKNDLLVFCLSSDKEKRDDEKRSELQARGVQIEETGTAESDGRLDLRAVLHRLGQLEITSLMIEGGSTLNAAALSSDTVDKAFLYYAPKIMGSTGAVPFLAGGLAENRPLHDVTVHRFDDDIALEGYIRDPYQI